MEVKFSPSANIIRDSQKELRYIITPNAERVARQITNDFKKGFHSFSIVGSYGTGKSLFLLALQQTLQGRRKYFDISLTAGKGKVQVINFVGEYQSIINSFAEQLGVRTKSGGNQEVLDTIYQEYEKVGKKDGLLIIAVDEMGKFLEYAAKNHPEKELYFIQQLAEFVNDKQRNILFISTLHQSFESYTNVLNESQRKEWSKVKGRLKDLPFNEPVEQLLLLASKHFNQIFSYKTQKENIEELISLNKKSHAFSTSKEFAEKIGKEIYPLDIFSAYVLTLALQQYGQNERSLFTFLESTDQFGVNQWEPKQSKFYSLSNVYDYLLYNFYSFISTAKHNPHYTQWASIKSAIERAESVIEKDLSVALQLIKTIGLLNLFASKGGKINGDFLKKYCKLCLGTDNISSALSELEKYKIVRFNKYSQSYKLLEGTDLDIDAELLRVGSKIDEVTDVLGSLRPYFDQTFVTAKSVSYLSGTPRNFEVIISEEPIYQTPKDEVDGYINIIFNEDYTEKQLKASSQKTEEAILYGYFQNTTQIKNLLLEIEKMEKVLEENHDDAVARKELKTIIEHQKNLLNHYVLDGFYSKDKIVWAFDGNKKTISSKKQFNRLLSEICVNVYSETPTYRNELVNKHKTSNARKLFFAAMVNNCDKPNLGFKDNEFPPEKTVYLSLLKENGMHRETKQGHELIPPDRNSSFAEVWQECERFLDKSKNSKRKLSELIDILSARPYKLKLGLIDFWLPTFLFIKRGDYALYQDGIFSPNINESILYLVTRNPQEFEVKAFELSGIRLKLFNKYREYLQLSKKAKLTNDAFIESIRPFLTFYKQLPEYCKNTQLLSKEAKALRIAIVNAQDPEKVFFEDFPAALKLTLDELSNSNKALAKFAQALNETVDEIKNAYRELLNRIEKFIQDEVVADKGEFPSYKKSLQNRFSSIREHQLLPHQRAFMQRLNSPLDDRDSWIASIAQPIIQKPLDQIIDEDECKLKDKILHLVKELDNLREIYKEQKSNNEVIKLDLTTIKSGLKSSIIEIPKGKTVEVEKLVNEIQKQLKSRENISLAVLAKLLSEQLKDAKS